MYQSSVMCKEVHDIHTRGICISVAHVCSSINYGVTAVLLFIIRTHYFFLHLFHCHLIFRIWQVISQWLINSLMLTYQVYFRHTRSSFMQSRWILQTLQCVIFSLLFNIATAEGSVFLNVTSNRTFPEIPNSQQLFNSSYLSSDLISNSTHITHGNAMQNNTFDANSIVAPTAQNVIVGRRVNISEIAFSVNTTELSPSNSTLMGESPSGLSSGAIAGITIACLIVLAVIGGVAFYMVNKQRAKAGTEVKDTPNNHYTGIWDDGIMLSYINSQFDVPKEPPDELVSLENDAYLNSLESMTASNWGPPKHNTRF